MLATRITLIFLLSCCGLISVAQNNSFNNSDTINIIDVSGKKHGHWIAWGTSKPNTCYKPEQKVEEGFYKDNKKTGVWTEYYCNGNKKSNITFKNGVPDGPATIYHNNGKIAEEGTWKVKQWIGEYKLYNPDGTVEEYYYDEKGNKIDAPPTRNFPNPNRN